MSDINNVFLVGRLTKDAELKTTNNGFAISKFSIAVNRNRKNGDKYEDVANFFDIVLMGKKASALNQYLLKGKQVGIQGELKQERWTNESGSHSRVEIMAYEVQFFGGTTGSGNTKPVNEPDNYAGIDW